MTNKIKTAPIPLVTILFERIENPNAPSADNGTAVIENKKTFFYSIWFSPNAILDRLPINCVIVSTGIASSAPAYRVSTGRSKNAPPKPEAPEINAAVKLDSSKTPYISINNVPFADSCYFLS
jgi:hypothetical protein